MARTGRFIGYEFWGDGDPMFGGKADDRALGRGGSFLPTMHQWHEVASFPTQEAAIEAANAASNRRADGLISALAWHVPDWVTAGEMARYLTGAD